MTLLALSPPLDTADTADTAATSRLDLSAWPLTAHVELGRLCVGAVALAEVAETFGTPTYVLDEADFRQRIHRYRAALPGVDMVYAGNALLTTAVARWIADEGVGLGVCSSGELAVALAGGVDPSRIIMGGDAKTPDELRDAATIGVGRIVVDSPIEAALLVGWVRHRQQVLIRVTPEIHTNGRVRVTTDAGVKGVLDDPCLELVGLYCDVGSHVPDARRYGRAICRMISAMAEIRDTHGVVLSELNIGGGHAVPYVRGDRALDLGELAAVIERALDTACAVHRFPRPTVVVEPGREISARAGVTLCRVLAVHSEPGGRTFVAVDGGIGAKYPAVLANRHSVTPTGPVAVLGRHSDGGDEIARDVDLPTDIRAGDLLAVAGNGHAVPRPPLVAVSGGQARELVRRETVSDLLLRDTGSTPGPGQSTGASPRPSREN
jgi:diaminopimelate decarboxylase